MLLDRAGVLSSLLILFTFLNACGGGSGTGAEIPLIAPIVLGVTPTGLLPASLTTELRGPRLKRLLDVSEIRSRFFSDSPTEINGLLETIDSRVTEINTRSAESERTCLSNSPVEESMSIFGQTVVAQFQCYDLFGDGTGGMLFGKKDGVWYLYTNVGDQRTFAKVTPISSSAGDYQVEAWISVGQNNPGGSYGVIQLNADENTNIFEMTAAGTGMGYCGVHLNSDGTNLYIKDSAGDPGSCTTADTLCGTFSDPDIAGTCTEVDDDNFALSSLGVEGESTFGSGITLDETSDDSVHFGRTVDDLDGVAGTTAF